MRAKRGRNKKQKTLDPIGEDETRGVTGKEGKGFFACYLLTSLSPRHKGHSYIGFTVNPKRRIRQHNGEITSGAWSTKKKRPWEMVLCIYGFPTNVSALQFEWAWQNPRISLAVRDAAATIKSLTGLAGKIKLAYTMLTLPSWNSLNLTVNYFSTKYAHHGGLSPSLPSHMKVQVFAMDDLPCYTKVGNNSQPEDEESPGDDEDKEEDDDSSNQSQSQDSTTSSLNDFEKAKEPDTVLDEDRLANFSGFGLLDDEIIEDEVSHSTEGSIEAVEKDCWRRSSSNDFDKAKEPVIVLDEDRLANFTGFDLLDDETVEDEVLHSTVGSIEAVEKDCWRRSSSNDFDKAKEQVIVLDEDRLANFTGFGLLDDETVEVSHSTAKSVEAAREDCWKRSNLVTMTSTNEVDVIDLLTPSPSCRAGSSMKRRRVSEFIDLTMSPSFIEL